MKDFIQAYIKKLVSILKKGSYFALVLCIVATPSSTFCGAVLGHWSFWWVIIALLVSVLLLPVASILEERFDIF